MRSVPMGMLGMSAPQLCAWRSVWTRVWFRRYITTSAQHMHRTGFAGTRLVRFRRWARSRGLAYKIYIGIPRVCPCPCPCPGVLGRFLIVGGAGERQGRIDTSFILQRTFLAFSIPNRSKHVTEISRCVVVGRLFFPKFHSGFR